MATLRLAILALLSLGLFSVGCDDWTGIEVACTGLPCPAGLTVQLEGTPSTEYSVAARVPGVAPWVLECTAENPCAPIGFPHFTPGTVDVTYTSQDTVVTRTFTPQYEVSYPNGRGCGECRHATVVLPIGG